MSLRSNLHNPNINNLRYANDTILMAESKKELKSFLIESERGEWKSWLKIQHSKNKDHGIQSHHFMANRWGEKMKTVTDFIFLSSKITVDSDCSHEIKALASWKKSYDKPAAAAAAKLLQLCPTLCDPTDGSPPGTPVPGIL